MPDRTERALPVELGDLGAKLRARRQELGLGLQQVAPRGDHTHLSRVERGLEWPSRDLIVHLEQVLAVPRGDYLKEFIERCEPKRHSAQAGYRRSGRPTSSLASAETPLFLNDRDGKRLRRLVPPVVAEYRADEPRPYRMVSMAIDQTIDLDRRFTRTMRSWTISATADGVETFDFILTPPVGRSVDNLDVAILAGGELERVQRHGANLFHYWVRLPTPLARRKRQTIEVVSGINGMSYRPAHLANAVYAKLREVEIEVRFANQRPRLVWWFDALPHEGVPGVPAVERTLVLSEEGGVQHTFAPAVGLSHGVGWL
jgi:transcriptional regulator with XRE-family HTH domain